MSDSSDELAILVLSCDKYREVAALTIRQLVDQGADRIFPCFYAAGSGNIDDTGCFTRIKLQNPTTWSADLRTSLLQIPFPYVLLWIDDLVPLEPLDWHKVKLLVNWLSSSNGIYLRLNPTPEGAGEIAAEGIRLIPKKSAYRASTVFSVWRKDALINLIVDSETAWQFEIAGSRRSDKYDGFYASDRFNVSYINLVIKGLVEPKAEATLNLRHVDCAIVNLPRMSYSKSIYLNLREKCGSIIRLLPLSLQHKIREYIYK